MDNSSNLAEMYQVNHEEGQLSDTVTTKLRILEVVKWQATPIDINVGSMNDVAYVTFPIFHPFTPEVRSQILYAIVQPLKNAGWGIDLQFTAIQDTNWTVRLTSI